MIRQVREFHRKFGLPDGKEDVLSSDRDLQSFRLMCLYEEVKEFEDALLTEDKVAAFDALLDLQYFLLGTALTMGIDPSQWLVGFDHVHDANMQKVRAQKASDSKRGSTHDVVKPAGWTGPEDKLRRVLGWPRD